MTILLMLCFLLMKWVFGDLNNITLDNNFDEDYPDTIY